MSLSRPVGLVLGLLAAGGLACSDASGPGNGGNGGNGGSGGTGGTGTPTLSGDVQPILSANCAFSGCHAGASPQQGMNLSSGQTFANTVNVASNESNLDRIEPGQPDQSYLVHKIQGTQAQVGGSGARMPLGAPALPQADIDVIRAWITAGAQNN